MATKFEQAREVGKLMKEAMRSKKEPAATEAVAKKLDLKPVTIIERYRLFKDMEEFYGEKSGTREAVITKTEKDLATANAKLTLIEASEDKYKVAIEKLNAANSTYANTIIEVKQALKSREAHMEALNTFMTGIKVAGGSRTTPYYVAMETISATYNKLCAKLFSDDDKPGVTVSWAID